MSMSQQTQYQLILVATLAVVGVLGYFHVLDSVLATALIPSIITAIVTLPVKLNSDAGTNSLSMRMTQSQVPVQSPAARLPFVPQRASRPAQPVQPVQQVQEQDTDQGVEQGHSLM